MRLHLRLLHKYSSAVFDLPKRAVSFPTQLLCPPQPKCNDKNHFLMSPSLFSLSSCFEGLSPRSVSQQKGYFDNHEA